jgi:FkbM family methyltransferase
MNFSGLSRGTLLGRLARLPLALLPTDIAVPIVQGPMRGRKWVIGASTHGTWLGSYEWEKQILLRSLIAKDSVFYDIGANVGFYTLLASVVTGSEGIVYAFEPLPRNLVYLHRHVDMNRLPNVAVFDCALGDTNGEVGFWEGDSPSEAHIAVDAPLKVRMFTLDHVREAYQLKPPDVLKIDVEGAEAAVLRGAVNTLCEYSPVIVLATHGADVHQTCVELLAEYGYQVQLIGDHQDELIARKRA